MVQLQHPKTVADATLHRSAPMRSGLVTIVFMALYALIAQEMYATMGLPREEAMEQANALRDGAAAVGGAGATERQKPLHQL